MAVRPLVVGIGNPERGDDGVGRAVAARLRAAAGDRLDIVEHDGDAASLLELLEQAGVAYLIDAAASGSTPGTIHRFDARRAPLPERLLAISTHGLGVSEAIELARAMGSLPSRCVVFAVEGSAFEIGRGRLTSPVEHAADEAANRILAELDAPPASEPGRNGLLSPEREDRRRR